MASSTSLACSTLTSTFMHTFLVIPKNFYLGILHLAIQFIFSENLSVDVVGTYASEKGSRVAKRTALVYVAHKSRKSVCSSSGVGGSVLATLGSGFGSSHAEEG